MSSESPLPKWRSFANSSPGRSHGRRSSFFEPFNNIPGMGILTFSFLVGLIFYTAVLSPQGPLSLSSSESNRVSRPYTSPILHSASNKSTPANYASSSPPYEESDETSSPQSDALSLKQIRDIVGTTRGFFARYYSLDLGWNNVSIHANLIRVELIKSQKKMQYILESSLLEANLLNRTLIIPTYVYARACEYHMYVCLFHTCGFISTHLRAQ